MPEHDSEQQAKTPYWEGEFHKLPAAVLTDYLRVFTATHRFYDGGRIGAGELRRRFVVIDDTGELQVQPLDRDRLGNLGWDDLGDPLWRGVNRWARLHPEYRCVGLAAGNAYNLWPWGRVPTTRIHVRVAHRDSAPSERTMFDFPIITEGRFRRRIRFEPERVALVRRWTDARHEG